MSAEDSRALVELCEFREKVSELQKRVSGFPSDAGAPLFAGVAPPMDAKIREAFRDALNTFLNAIGIYEIRLQNRGG
jgi:hypothetical protein